jgi:hypothetical protein
VLVVVIHGAKTKSGAGAPIRDTLTPLVARLMDFRYCLTDLRNLLRFQLDGDQHCGHPSCRSPAAPALRLRHLRFAVSFTVTFAPEMSTFAASASSFSFAELGDDVLVRRYSSGARACDSRGQDADRFLDRL